MVFKLNQHTLEVCVGTLLHLILYEVTDDTMYFTNHARYQGCIL